MTCTPVRKPCSSSPLVYMHHHRAMSGQLYVSHSLRRRDTRSFQYSGLSQVIRLEVKVQLSLKWLAEFSSELAKLYN